MATILKDLLKTIMTEYKNTTGKWSKTHPDFDRWKNIKTKIINEIIATDKFNLDTYDFGLQKDDKASVPGNSGKWATVFGISIRNKTFSSVQEGVYITYLINKESGDCYLTLTQAAKEYDNNVTKIKNRVKALRQNLDNKLKASTFDFTSTPETGKAEYDAGVIAYKTYTTANIPDDEQLYADLTELRDLYEYYMDKIYSNATSSATTSTVTACPYTDDRLCEILKGMIEDANKIKRKNAALAVFGIVYGEYITKYNMNKLLSVTAAIDGNRSNSQQIEAGRIIYTLQQENPSIDVFSIKPNTTVTANELQDEFNTLITEAKKDKREEATSIVFGIQNSQLIETNTINSKNIDTKKSSRIDLGRQIAEFINKFPQHAKKAPLVDANLLVVRYSDIVTKSYNTIFRGAPGTGKSYLAKSVATYIISNGTTLDYETLIPEQQKRIGFVQFHPSYDYSDFVEGLRPTKSTGNDITFELKSGIFKRFVEQARDSYEDWEKEHLTESPDKYVFIIDEINRGEISKILGELFFSVDPGYRGDKNGVFTQYANMHDDPNEKFYIPKNVYIIGTMNDIDRSVDTFDFAMRRRFRFVEIKASEHTEMLNALNDDFLKNEAIARMNALNAAISDTEGLNSNYHIGAAYFSKLDSIGFPDLWFDYLEPLLQEYVNGMAEDKKEMQKFKDAYDSKKYKDIFFGDSNNEETADDVNDEDEDDDIINTDDNTETSIDD